MGRGLVAESEEGERRLGQHGEGEVERGEHDQRRGDVREDVPRQDARRRGAERYRRFNVGRLPHGQRRSAHDAHEGRRVDDGDRDHRVGEVVAQQSR